MAICCPVFAIPPFENFTKFAKWGVDMYCFSGGKELSGPRCSGLLLDRKNRIVGSRLREVPEEGALA